MRTIKAYWQPAAVFASGGAGVAGVVGTLTHYLGTCWPGVGVGGALTCAGVLWVTAHTETDEDVTP